MNETQGCPRDGSDGLSRRDLLRTGVAAGGIAAAMQFVPSGTHPALGATANALIWPTPKIVTRKQWGADESQRVAPPSYDSKVQKLVVHHTATSNSRSDYNAQIRNIFNYHVSRLYSDIAYNLLIDEQGTIYEGRWATDYAADMAPTGEDALQRQVRGAHALNHNSRTIGIALVGTFDTVAPPVPMVDALVEVLAWKCSRWDLDPTGSSDYADALGTRVHLPNILSHRDIRQTRCPGNATRALLPSVRARVKQIVDARLLQARSEVRDDLQGPQPRHRQTRG